MRNRIKFWTAELDMPPVADSERKKEKKEIRRSNSFTKDEINIACDIFMALLQKKDVSILVKRKEFQTLHARFIRMRDSIRADELAARKKTST